jgi:N6-L-threonylcarbamoyladenine synthase
MLHNLKPRASPRNFFAHGSFHLCSVIIQVSFVAMIGMLNSSCRAFQKSQWKAPKLFRNSILQRKYPNSRCSIRSNVSRRLAELIYPQLRDILDDVAESSTRLQSNESSNSQPKISYKFIQELGAEKIAAREKRKKLLRVAKATDRGLPHVTTYKPCVVHADGSVSFTAKSGLPNRTRLFTVLGIESSCDDTGAAIVRSDGVILGEALAKQHEIHEPWGGVVPGLARDAHVNAMDNVVETALRNAGLTSVDDVDAIAATIGPGLEICLRVGCQKAVQLAKIFNKPFVGVHHLEAHILMARLPFENSSVKVQYPPAADVHETTRTVEFPFLALLVSGGHCQLIKCLGIGQYEILGGTLDDSLGEAYDKVARLLGLPVGGGGGPAVEELAKKGDPKAIPFTLPMQTSKTLDFSYAGLKTNVRRACEKMVRDWNTEAHLDQSTENVVEGDSPVTSPPITSVSQLPEEDKAKIAASFQHIAIRHIEERLKRAMSLLESDQSNINTLALVGGVAANQELRSRVETLCSSRETPWRLLVPPPRLCTDQGT